MRKIIQGKSHYRQAGIGLLELMLALAIIAILMVMATRYFNLSVMSQETNTALMQITEIQGALYKWKNKYGDYAELISQGSVKALQTLADKGYITQQVVSGSPFAGSSFELGGTSQFVTIYLKKLPQTACKNLVQKISGAIDDCETEYHQVSVPVDY